MCSRSVCSRSRCPQGDARLAREASVCGGMDYYSARLERGWEATKRALRHPEPPRLFAISAAPVFSVATVARSVEFPEKDWWEPGKPATYVLLAAGAIAGAGAVVNAVRVSRRTQGATLYEACVQLAAYIDEKCPSLSLREVGIHVWRVGGPPFARRLHRPQQFLLRSRQPSHVAFTKGKGLIGKVWATGVPDIKNLENDYAGVDTEAEFVQLGDDDRLGLSWEEFQRTRRYKAVWASPLFRKSDYDDRVVGVISVDIQASGVFDEVVSATTENPGPEWMPSLQRAKLHLVARGEGAHGKEPHSR